MLLLVKGKKQSTSIPATVKWFGRTIFKFICSKQKTHFTLATSGVCILAYGQRTQQHCTLNSKEFKPLKEAIFSKD